MLSPRMTGRWPRPRSGRTAGVVLVLVLIVLVALSLAALALNRSVFTSTLVAGNLAFQRSTAHSADIGIETAVAWLESNTGLASSSTATTCTTGSTVLACNQTARGYLASRQDPSSSQTWAAFWTATLSASAVSLSADAAGNTVSYVIQRMCSGAGDASSSAITCDTAPSVAPSNCSTASSCDAQKINLVSVNAGSGKNGSAVYFRITVRVTGPRNTSTMVQSVIAL